MSAVTLFWLHYAPAAIGGVLALIADAFGRRRLVAVPAAAGLMVGGGFGLYSGWATDPVTVYETFVVGAGFSTVWGIVAVLAALILIAGLGEISPRGNEGTVWVLIVLAALAAGLTAASFNLVSLLLCIETVALASYALVSAARNRRADESAMKYYVQGAVSTGVLLLGIAVLVALFAPDGSYATLASGVPAALVRNPSPALLGSLLLVTALAFKAGAAPFHSWAPDAYENAPSDSAAFMAGPLKLAFLFALALFVTTLGPLGSSKSALLGVLGADLFPILGALGLLSIAVGSLAALKQEQYSRMLGYAGVAQVGYAMIAAGSLSPLAVSAFTATYAVGVSGAFVAAFAFRRMRPSWDGTIQGLRGLGRRSMSLGISMTLLMMSLAGLPPMLGFWGKFEALLAPVGAAQQAFAAGHRGLAVWYGSLAVVALAGSVVSLGYYGGVVRELFSKDGADPQVAGEEAARWRPALMLLLFGILVLLLGAVPLLGGLSVPLQGFSFS